MKRICSLLLCLVLLFCLTGCSGGISGDEAKAHIASFLEAVSAGDFAKAAEHLHPDRPADLAAYFDSIEQGLGVDFQSGVTVEKYTGFRSAVYDSSVGGSAYTLDMQLSVGQTTLTASIEVVRNDSGFGIYNLDISE